MSLELNKNFIREYIQKAWNNQGTENLAHFIHDEYCDHSFVPGVPPNREGLKFWIQNTSAAFEHHTTIESIVAEGDMVAARISFKVKHTGKWRNIEPTGKEVQVKGFRHFRLKEGKIVEHWALLDGESMLTALTEVHHGCEVPQK